MLTLIIDVLVTSGRMCCSFGWRRAGSLKTS